MNAMCFNYTHERVSLWTELPGMGNIFYLFHESVDNREKRVSFQHL